VPEKQTFGSVLFTVTPYFDLATGGPSAACGGCANQIGGYRQSWGLVVSRLAFHVGF
jgi:hypothetical protein